VELEARLLSGVFLESAVVAPSYSAASPLALMASKANLRCWN